METTLRPLTLGEILDRTAQLYRSNFFLFAGIASVYAGALLVLGLGQIGVQELLRISHRDSQIVWATVAGMLIMSPIIVIVGGFAVAANNRAVALVYLGETATIRGAYRSILSRWSRYLWLMTITTCVVWLPFGLIYAGYVGFYLLYIRPHGVLVQTQAHKDPQALVVFLVVTLAFSVLVLGAIAYAIVMGLRYALAIPASVVEDLPARKALRRSIDLSAGSRGRIFLLGLLVVAIQVGLALITQLFFVVAAVKQHGAALPAGVRALQQIIAFFTHAFIGPIYATGFTLFYYDQRVRKEGFDIEWMMRAAGLATVPEIALDALPENEVAAPAGMGNGNE